MSAREHTVTLFLQEIQTHPMARLVFGLSGVGRVESLDSGEKRKPGRPPGSKKKAPQQNTPSDVDLDTEVLRIRVASS